MKRSLRVQSIVVLAVILAVGGAALAYWRLNSDRTAIGERDDAANAPVDSAGDGTVPQGGIGQEIYERSQEPMKDKLPETNPFAADTNPMKGNYENPFK